MIASPQQVVIRVLTGLHAGAEISLSHGSHEIGSDLECTIVISDWPAQRSLFSIEEHATGNLQVRFHDAALPTPFGLHAPIRFGDIVIVASDPGQERERPSDLTLLTQLLAPVAPPSPPPQRRGIAGTWVVGGIVVAVALAGAFTLQSPRSVAATNVRTSQMTTLENVKAVVAKLHYAGVYVVPDGERIAVTGIVRNRAEAKTLAAQLATLQLDTLEQRYAVESEIAAAISDAIARPGISVKHLGAGRFEIRGDIPPAVMQKIDLKRLKNDLGTVVSSISFQEPVGTGSQAEEPSNLQDKEDYQVKQGGDGIKYFMPKNASTNR